MFFSRNLDLKVCVGDVVHVGFVVFLFSGEVDGSRWDCFIFSYKTHDGSMYGKFTYICHKNQPNVGKNFYTWILWETVYR